MGMVHGPSASKLKLHAGEVTINVEVATTGRVGDTRVERACA